MAKIIAIEGPDRVGKATQTSLLVDHLKSKPPFTRFGVMYYTDATSVEVPVKGFLHSTIYYMLRNGLAKRCPNLFQIVQSLNKFWFQIFHLKHFNVDYVILDRWKLSTYVYGKATEVHPILLRVFDYLLVEPDVTIILGGSAQVDEARDSYERDSELQRLVRTTYAKIANEKDKHFVINANQTREAVHNDIVNVLKNVI